MFKKIIAIKICLLCMAFSVVNVFAVVDPIYKEEGQINLKNFNLSPNDEIIIASAYMQNTNEELNTLCKNSEIKKDIINEFKEKSSLDGIGYTTYMLKQMIDEEGNIHY